MQRSDTDKGCLFKGTFFPEGTEFRAIYKERTYTASIKNGAWRDSGGFVSTSPSDAAFSVTGSRMNGWHFGNVSAPVIHHGSG